MKSFVIQLPSELKEKLRGVSFEKRRSMADLIREAVEKYLINMEIEYTKQLIKNLE